MRNTTSALKWKVRDTLLSSIPCVTLTSPTSTTSAHHLHPHHLRHQYELLVQPQQQHHYHPTVSVRVAVISLGRRLILILFRRRLSARGRRWWLWWHPVNECCCLQGWWRSSHLPQHPLSWLPFGGEVPASFLLHFSLWRLASCSISLLHCRRSWWIQTFTSLQQTMLFSPRHWYVNDATSTRAGA